MSNHPPWRRPGLRARRAATALALLLVLTGVLTISSGAVGRAPLAVREPPAEAQQYSVSVGKGSPAAEAGVHPADILGAGGLVLITCADLGLLCDDGAEALDDIVALSYGDEFATPELPPLNFSVATGAAGAASSAVAAEAGCSPAQAQADVFQTDLAGSNAQDLDGDGVACAANAGFGLALAETPQSDEVDALAGDPCSSVDFDCDGQIDDAVLLVLASGSPTLAFLSATPADILAAPGGIEPYVWAGRADLGLASGDVIDGLCIAENGNGAFDAGDTVLLSLAPASPSLATLGAGAGDLLVPAPLRMAQQASALGLAAGDDVDALLCNSALTVAGNATYLPVISK